MCRNNECQYAISAGETGVVVTCGFYRKLKDLPDDCRVPQILADVDDGAEEIIDLIDEIK
jgi:hypothetical protein